MNTDTLLRSSSYEGQAQTKIGERKAYRELSVEGALAEAARRVIEDWPLHRRKYLASSIGRLKDKLERWQKAQNA